MEGVLNLVAYQVTGLDKRMEHIEKRVAAVEMAQARSGDSGSLAARVAAVELTQATNNGASSSWKTWLPTILIALGLLATLGFGIHFRG
jgi:hypothetical protein